VVSEVMLRYLSDSHFEHSGIIGTVLADSIRQTTFNSLGIMAVSDDAITFSL
jgi:hypothetical protein